MPKIVDHHRRREDLALLTLRVISAVGIENATVREIARRGGLSTGSLTHYFTSKDDLVAFAFRWLAEKSFAELDQLAAFHPRAPETRGRRRCHVPVRGTRGIGLWLSVWERATRNPAFASEHRAFYARWRSYVRTCLSDACALQQTRRRVDLDEATDLIVAAVDGLWIGGAFEPERFAAPRRRLLLRLQLDALTGAVASRALAAPPRRRRRSRSHA